MIPKIIHWCWIGGNPIPEDIQNCINTWKEKLPEYQIKCWTEKTFDIESVPYVKEAYTQKKWAFCADYIRAYALYTEGGIYLDSDVEVLKKFDDLLNYSFFSSVEILPSIVNTLDVNKKYLNKDYERLPEVSYVPGLGIHSAVLAAEKGCSYMLDVINYYGTLHFSMNKGYDNMILVATNVYAINAEKYGFKYKNEDQHLKNNMIIFKDEVFCIPEFSTKRTYTLHHVAHSWYEPTTMQKIYQFFSTSKTLKSIYKSLENNRYTKGLIATIKKNVWLK